MNQISVVIHTKNSEKTLKRAIQSVSGWAAEVLVVDMHSKDGTVELAKELDARVLKVEDAGFADPARNEAISKAVGPWVLVLDSDEEIPLTLATALQQLAQQGNAEVYYLPRKNMIFGKWARTGWWPDYIPRFFQKGKITWPPTVHAAPVVIGKAEYLEPKEEYAILHHNYETVEEFVDRMNRYTTLAAGQNHTDEYHMLRSAYDEFIRRYYEKKGHEGGTYGLSLSLLQMCYECIAAVKRWEKEGLKDDSQGKLVEDELERMYLHLCYWIADKHVQQERSFIKKLYWRIRRKLML